MAKPKDRTLFRWLILLLIPALWCAASYFGLTEFLENKLLDWRFRARGELSAPIKVVYVDVDSESITDLGNQPWNRGYYAEVCRALLTAGKVKAIGIDFVFSEKGQPELVDTARFSEGNRQLAKFLYDAPPVVVAAGYAASEDRDINGNPIVRVLPRVENPPANPQPPELPEFRVGPTIWNPPNVGLIDTINGGTRFVPLLVNVGEVTYFHMAVELARLYWGLPKGSVQAEGDRLLFRDDAGKALASVPLIHRQDVEVNWFSPWSSPEHNPRASFAEVLQHARDLGSSENNERDAAKRFFAPFAGAVVLIGPVDPLLQDIAATPLDARPVPKVGIHGNLLKTIVSGIYLHRVPFVGQVAIVFLLSVVVAGLAIGTGRRTVLWRSAAGAVFLVYAAGAFLVFAQWHWIWPMAAPLGAALTTSFAGVTWQLAREEKQKGRIKSMFGTYVSPELVEQMVNSGEDPQLGGAEADITAYFSDIQDFSGFAEMLSPTQLVELMNEYLTACTDIITAEGGTLDKYIGDAVVAMFGAPLAMEDHAYRACIASQKVQQRLFELRQKWSQTGSRWPNAVSRMKTRIGLNSGAAVVGNMGSLTRFNYTMMGDSVNLASRLESGAKTYGVSTLVTESTKASCERFGQECVFRFIDRIVVKGRTKPVSIYELVGLRTALAPSVLDGVEEFSSGMEAYLRRDWDRAIAAFAKANALGAAAADALDGVNPSSVYLRRCELMKQTPPPDDWNGVWVMQTK
ncbi:MAG TPA: adenylate/guanylate cyclase domain-containing protein [Opitutaceae bacterium]|nr:adenylate/guanylate cyclase domain-containing protein [Opitutaceae bacterium]